MSKQSDALQAADVGMIEDATDQPGAESAASLLVDNIDVTRISVGTEVRDDTGHTDLTSLL